jgi:hypothetical protein
VVTFVIPVRDHRGVEDWPTTCAHLASAVASVTAQTAPNWRCVVVASKDAPLPPLPSGVVVERVSLPYVELPDRDSDLDARLRAIRGDKGRRVLAGARHADPAGYLMVVDHDDVVSSRIAAHVAQNAGRPGWFVDRGLAWEGGRLAVEIPSGFAQTCGTSLVVRTALWTWPASLETVDEELVQRHLGSHVHLVPDLVAAGHDIEPLPFAGAAYRVGHAEATSTPLGLRARWLSLSLLRDDPRTWLVHAGRVRWLTGRRLKEAFGASA